MPWNGTNKKAQRCAHTAKQTNEKLQREEQSEKRKRAKGKRESVRSDEMSVQENQRNLTLTYINL